MTPRKHLKTLSFIHLAIMAGPLLTGLFVFLETDLRAEDVYQGPKALIFAFTTLAVTGFFGGKYLYEKLLGPLRRKDSLKEKLMGFQRALFINYLFLEGSALLNIFAFHFTGNLLFLTLAATLTLCLWALRPTKNKIERDLELKGAHKRQFNMLDTPLT